MKNRVFHSVTIRGVRFDGLVDSDGPCLSSNRGWTPLGVCSLRNFVPERPNHHRERRGWWVVKYYAEARIDLTHFTIADAARLADEFGLFSEDGSAPDSFHPASTRRFMASPAWSGLCRWVSAHPRLARKHAADDDYMPGWLTRALIQNEVFSRLDGAAAH